MLCGCCDKYEVVNVYATVAPVSIGYCNECILNDAEAYWIILGFPLSFISANKNRASKMATFYNGKYITYNEILSIPEFLTKLESLV